MPQQITDGFQGCSLTQEVKRVGMPNAVCPFEGDLQSTPTRPCLKRLDHCAGLQSAPRCSETKEDLPMGAIATDLLEVGLNREADLIGQREFQRLTRFCSGECESVHCASEYRRA